MGLLTMLPGDTPIQQPVTDRDTTAYWPARAKVIPALPLVSDYAVYAVCILTAVWLLGVL